MKKTVFDYFVMNNKGDDIVRCKDRDTAEHIHTLLKKAHPSEYFGWGKLNVVADEDTHLKKFEHFGQIKLMLN